MAANKAGRHSFTLSQPVTLAGWASVVGKKEGEGPLGSSFDQVCRDPLLGQRSWEQAEKQLQQQTLRTLLKKTDCSMGELDLVFSGDLLNQCIGSSFPLRNKDVPHLGLYGACSTMAEALLLGAVAVSAGIGDRVAVMTSSHFASAEKQYRFPLGYGGQRTPTAQWTVTGAGAVLLTPFGAGPRIDCCTVGTVTDLGIRDSTNMGAAMAPAALSTLRTHLEDTGRRARDYDRIVTGDLGQCGRELLLELARREGLELAGRLADCGCMIFGPGQDAGAGGSGCGCSAAVLCGRLLEDLASGKYRRILFCGTGALLSPASTQQKLPIPAICHAVSIEGGTGK